MYRFILADTETTGVKQTDAVCEVAWREITEDFQTVAEGASLINPLMPIHYAASAVNGITDAMVANAPTLDEYMRSVGDPLMGDDVVLIGHNIAFDERFLKPHMSDGAKTLCTLKAARIIYPEAENYKQSTLAAMLGIEVPREKAHSADGDLDVLGQLLQCLCRDAGCGLRDMLDVQNKPVKITKMPFGKHKGVALTDIPADYKHWLLHKCENLNPDLRASLQAL